MLGSTRIYSFITLACVSMSISFSSIAKEEVRAKKVVEIENTNTADAVLKDEVKSTQASVKSETKLAQTSVKEKTPKFSAVLDVTLQTNSNQLSSDEKSLSATNWLFLNYQINSLYKARLWLSYSKDLATSYKDTLNNTRLTFSRQAFQITEKFSLSPSANLLLPTSEVARRSQSLNGGLELGTSFKYKFNDKIGGSYFVRAGKNFHDFTTSEDNKVNAEYTLLQILALSFSITEKIYFSPALIYNNNWSYLGTQRDPSYTTWLELGYILSDKLSLGLGASTGGSLENRQNGPDQTINIIDRNTTNYFAKFALRF